MNNQILSIASAFFLALVLSACGGEQDLHAANQSDTRTAGDTIAAIPGTTTAEAARLTAPDAVAADAATTASSAAAPGLPAAGTSMPLPDCAPEGCNGLRIIDGNAEAWRIDAGRRAALAARL